MKKSKHKPPTPRKDTQPVPTEPTTVFEGFRLPTEWADWLKATKEKLGKTKTRLIIEGLTLLRAKLTVK